MTYSPTLRRKEQLKYPPGFLAFLGRSGAVTNRSYRVQVRFPITEIIRNETVSLQRSGERIDRRHVKSETHLAQASIGNLRDDTPQGKIIVKPIIKFTPFL